MKIPGGAREQLTFFPDRVLSAEYEPVTGASFVFSKDIGGGEWYQLYRYDMASGDITLLTDGKSRNSGHLFEHKGSRIAYTSTRRTGQDTDLYTMNIHDPKTDRMLVELKGGGWEPTDWSPDGHHLLLLEEKSINESNLYLVDTATGDRRNKSRPHSSPGRIAALNVPALKNSANPTPPSAPRGNCSTPWRARGNWPSASARRSIWSSCRRIFGQSRTINLNTWITS